MTRLVIARKRQAKDIVPADLFRQIREIQGVHILGEWEGRQLQIEASDLARDEIRRRFGDVVHIEQLQTYKALT